jgi:hypothetical protein
MSEPEYTKRADELSGKVGHSSQALARKLGAVRRAYRELQRVQVARNERMRKAMQRANVASSDASQLRELFGMERRDLTRRIGQQADQLAECHRQLDRARLMRFVWLLLGIASHDIWTRIF